MKSIVVAAIVATLAIVLPGDGGHLVHARQNNDKTSGPSVAGQWTLNVKSPHGDVGMALDLTQEGKKITGTLATPHGDVLPVTGEFTENTLTLSTPGPGDSRITMTAKLIENGTLDGYLSSQMGDMTWTARRTTTK